MNIGFESTIFEIITIRLDKEIDIKQQLELFKNRSDFPNIEKIKYYNTVTDEIYVSDPDTIPLHFHCFVCGRISDETEVTHTTSCEGIDDLFLTQQGKNKLKDRIKARGLNPSDDILYSQLYGREKTIKNDKDMRKLIRNSLQIRYVLKRINKRITINIFKNKIHITCLPSYNYDNEDFRDYFRSYVIQNVLKGKFDFDFDDYNVHVKHIHLNIRLCNVNYKITPDGDKKIGHYLNEVDPSFAVNHYTRMIQIYKRFESRDDYENMIIYFKTYTNLIHNIAVENYTKVENQIKRRAKKFAYKNAKHVLCERDSDGNIVGKGNLYTIKCQNAYKNKYFKEGMNIKTPIPYSFWGKSPTYNRIIDHEGTYLSKFDQYEPCTVTIKYSPIKLTKARQKKGIFDFNPMQRHPLITLTNLIKHTESFDPSKINCDNTIQEYTKKRQQQKVLRHFVYGFPNNKYEEDSYEAQGFNNDFIDVKNRVCVQTDDKNFQESREFPGIKSELVQKFDDNINVKKNFIRDYINKLFENTKNKAYKVFKVDISRLSPNKKPYWMKFDSIHELFITKKEYDQCKKSKQCIIAYNMYNLENEERIFKQVPLRIVSFDIDLFDNTAVKFDSNEFNELIDKED